MMVREAVYGRVRPEFESLQAGSNREALPFEIGTFEASLAAHQMS